MKGRKLTGIGLMHFLLWMGSFHPALEKESLATDMEKLDRREAGDYLFLIRREKSFLFSVAEVCVPGSYAYLSWTAYAMIPGEQHSDVHPRLERLLAAGSWLL